MYKRQEPNLVVIVIDNDGLRSAENVTVTLSYDDVTLNKSLPVSASSSTDFEFVLPEAASQGITRYDVSVEVSEEDSPYVEGDLVDDDFGIEYVVQGSDDTSNPIVIITIIALIVLILYFGFKASARARGSSSRF
mgnify:FL=1